MFSAHACSGCQGIRQLVLSDGWLTIKKAVLRQWCLSPKQISTAWVDVSVLNRTKTTSMRKESTILLWQK